MATVAFVTNAGRALITNNLLNGASRGAGTANPPIYVSFGKSATAATQTDTALGTELTNTDTSPGTYARATGTASQQTTTVTNDTYQVVGTFTQPSNASASVTVTEVGCHDATTAGNMSFHATFTGIALSAGFGLQATCQHVFG